MALTRPTYDVDNIQSLADQPTESATVLKITFDKTGSDGKDFFDTHIDELESETDGVSGADGIGITPVTSVGAFTRIQAFLEGLVSKVLLTDNTTVYTPTSDYNPATKGYVDTTTAGVVLGQIPDNSLTDAKLGTDIKIGSLALLDTTDKTGVVNSINEVIADELVLQRRMQMGVFI